MRNVSDKFLENIEYTFYTQQLLQKILPFTRYCPKIWYSHTDHRWQ